MPKVLLICGSPRQGNTEYILRKIFNALDCEKSLILLREKNIKMCCGCLTCDKTGGCAISDDMTGLSEDLKSADIIIFGTPNYFDNLPGTFKNFLDRTNPFYKTQPLKDKIAISLVVGGGKIENSKRVAECALNYFYSASQLKDAGSFIFQALERDDLEKDAGIESKINAMIERINNLIKLK